MMAEAIGTGVAEADSESASRVVVSVLGTALVSFSLLEADALPVAVTAKGGPDVRERVDVIVICILVLVVTNGGIEGTAGVWEGIPQLAINPPKNNSVNQNRRKHPAKLGFENSLIIEEILITFRQILPRLIDIEPNT
jgi:hypothetical protein